jgi:hypothetical protein
VPPTAIVTDVSPGLEAIIMKALNRDPELRYQSAAELQADLQRLSGRLSDPPAGTSRRQRARVIEVIEVLLLVAVALGTLWQMTKPDSEEPRGQTAAATTAPVTPPAPVTPATDSRESRLRVAIMMPEVLTGTQSMPQWTALIQRLLASDLAGTQEVSVLDLQSVQGTIQDSKSGSEQLRALAASRVALAVQLRVLPSNKAHELECSVIDPAKEEVTFSTRVSIAGEQALRPAVRELSLALTDYFRLRLLGAELDQDLRPWISLRAYKVQAVRAFVQAAQYVFRYQPGEPRRYYQRALDIDPTFVAPRVWRANSLLVDGKRDVVAADLAYLRSIEA